MKPDCDSEKGVPPVERSMTAFDPTRDYMVVLPAEELAELRCVKAQWDAEHPEAAE